MLFPSVRGFSDYAGPKQPLAISAAAVLPSSYSEWSRHPDLRAFRSSIAPPTSASVYASRNTSRCPQQDSRSGWIRYFLSCRALASPTTCRFNPAHSGFPVTRPRSAAALQNSHFRNGVAGSDASQNWSYSGPVTHVFTKCENKMPASFRSSDERGLDQKADWRGLTVWD